MRWLLLLRDQTNKRHAQEPEVGSDVDLPRPAVALEDEDYEREDNGVSGEESRGDLQGERLSDEAQREHHEHQQRVDHVGDPQVREQPGDWRLPQPLDARLGRHRLVRAFLLVVGR